MRLPQALVLASLVVASTAIIVHDDTPQQLLDFFYAGPEFGFLPVPRYYHNRPVYSVARAVLPNNRIEPDAYDLHGLYHP